MKKVFVFAFGLFAASVTYAQSAPKLGLKGGLNIGRWSTDNGDVSSRLAPHLGLFAHIHLSDKIAFQPELLYSGQGTEQNFSGSNVEYKLDYLNIPLMLQYMFDNGFRVEAGPQIGFLLSAKQDGPSLNNQNIKGSFKDIDAALGVGLNYLSYSGLGVGGRYNFGISNINNQGTNNVRNQVAQISLFYMFDNDHKRRSR